MKRVQILAALVLALGALSATAAFAGTPEQGAEFNSISGKWKVMSVAINGQAPIMAEGNGIVLEFKDGKGMSRDKNGKLLGPADTIQLDGGATPKCMDTINPYGQITRAIYKMDGDTLTVCVGRTGGTRPQEFASRDGTMLFVLKRVK